MSREAIAAVLARTDVAAGERLVALALASFAGRENRAWPGAPAASARAGLSRSRYQHAREQLVARGLVAVDERVTGRGRASTVTLLFADAGPWWDGDINVELFEAVLTYSPVRGPERLLLATIAALADERGDVCDLSTEQLCAAAGIADPDLPACAHALLESGQLDLVSGAGGRGNTNVWTVRDPHDGGDALAARTPRRVAPPAGARPLVASASSPSSQERASAADEKGSHDRTVSPEMCPVLTGVSAQRQSRSDSSAREVSSPDRGFQGEGRSGSGTFRARAAGNAGETPAEPAAETPAAMARAGMNPEPQNQGRSPQPPEGGSPLDAILSRRRTSPLNVADADDQVRVDLHKVRRHLGIPGLVDRDDWEQVRNELRELVGDSTFEISLQPLELIAVDPVGTLVIAAPAATGGWVERRFSRVLARCGEQHSRALRLAE